MVLSTYKNLLFILQVLLLLTSCNLRPVYSTKYNPQELSQFNAIAIEAVNSIEGAELVYHLSYLLPRQSGTKVKYLLKIEFANKRLPSVIQKNSDTLREMIEQIVNYKLVDVQSDKVVTAGQFNHISTYSIDSAVYSSYTLGELELEQLTKRAAEEILARLILHFKRIESE